MNRTKPKIMIVDDNLVCRTQTETIAKKICECICVTNGEDAVETFINTFRNKERMFDAILLDYEMPEMSGVDVIIQIRKAEERRNISPDDKVKIIMATSHNDRDIVLACKSVGCNQYLLKPIVFTELQAKLKKYNLI